MLKIRKKDVKQLILFQRRFTGFCAVINIQELAIQRDQFLKSKEAGLGFIFIVLPIRQSYHISLFLFDHQQEPELPDNHCKNQFRFVCFKQDVKLRQQFRNRL